GEDREREQRFGLIDRFDRSVKNVGDVNETKADRQTSEKAKNDRLWDTRTYRETRNRRMLNDAHRSCLGVFFKVRFFDLPKDAFVEGTIRFGLSRQLQITDRCLIQR